LVDPPGLKIQMYHNQSLGGWAWAESAGGWKGGCVLWLRNFDKKQHLEGG
jgi:hypothetical protein